VLGWNFLKQVETEIRCAEHEIIPARNRHNGWLEEKLSVAVGRYYSVPGNRAGRLQHSDGHIEYGREPDQNEE